MKQFRNIVILITLLFRFYSKGQISSFKNFTTKDGLLSDEVYNLYQDKKGYIWLFTNYGTLRYNSLEFEPVLNNLPFNESFIFSITENERGQKWVANSNGRIYQIINDSAFIVKGTELISEQLRKGVDEIYQLFVDDSLNLYAITKRYSYKFEKRGEVYFPINLSSQIKHDSIVFQVFEMKNILIPVYNFLGSEARYLFERRGNAGILLPDKDGFTFHSIDEKAKGMPRVFKKIGSETYFSFYKRLAKSSKNGGIKYVNFDSFILNFTKDKKGHVWVACFNDGLYELNAHDSVINHYFKNKTINDVLIDSQGGLWASSAGNGVYYFKDLSSVHFNEDEALGGQISFIKHIDDKLFIAMLNGDLFMLKNGSINCIYRNKINQKPLDIIKYKSNFLLSFIFEIKELEIIENSCRIVRSTKISNAFKLFPISKDSVFYSHLRGVGLIVKTKLNKRVDLNIKTFDCERRGKEYILATDKGIYIWNKKFQNLPTNYNNDYPIYHDSLSQPDFLTTSKNSVVKKITRDNINRLWFSTIGSGIFVLDSRNKLHNLTIEDGLPSNVINDINFISKWNLLLCTNKGLFESMIEDTNLISYKWKKVYPGEISSAKFYENKVYLATKNGLVILDYNNADKFNKINFNINSINGKKQNIDSDYLNNIPYFENYLDAKFDLISFSEDSPEIEYYLKGPLRDSAVVKGTEFKINNLPSGSYTLIAFPNIYNGEELSIVIPFQIVPAFWQTTIFIICLSSIVLILIVFIASRIIKKNKNKKDNKNRSEKLILEYKLIALKAQINPHFVSNCLSAIQLLIINNKVDTATNYIAKFGLLVRQILNFSTRSLVSLKEELEIAQLNIELEQLRFENRFEFELIVDKTIVLKETFIPALILNPVIENAIWHGLLPLKGSRTGKLFIEVKLLTDSVSILIKDNGIGRQKNRESMGNSRLSKGMKLTEQRLTNINYLFNSNLSKIEYFDLFDGDKNAIGTEVLITIPLNINPIPDE